jgi:hypothetical protein
MFFSQRRNVSQRMVMALIAWLIGVVWISQAGFDRTSGRVLLPDGYYPVAGVIAYSGVALLITALLYFIFRSADRYLLWNRMVLGLAVTLPLAWYASAIFDAPSVHNAFAGWLLLLTIVMPISLLIKGIHDRMYEPHQTF